MALIFALVCSVYIDPTLKSDSNHLLVHEFNNEPNKPQIRCAFNFFGLPRSFKSLVLPSLIENVIIPNARYSCDYFVHCYNVTFEPPSRSGRGGRIRPDDVYLLQEAVHSIARTMNLSLPSVKSMVESEAAFERDYSNLLRRIRTNKPGKKNPFYGNEQAYTVETYVNIIKMWHSIAAVWGIMNDYASSQGIHYDRIAMLRSDVVYLTPIDVFKAGHGPAVDKLNKSALIPGFSLWPVNDRMFLGPHRGAKIWASGRFSRLHEFVYQRQQPLHSEQFLDIMILPTIRKLGISVDVDKDMCFVRARADGTVWNDCGDLSNKGIVEKFAKVNCSTDSDTVGGTVFKCPLL